jgi:hypothetical protein
VRNSIQGDALAPPPLDFHVKVSKPHVLYESAVLRIRRNANKFRKHLPMPWMRAASARSDVGCVRLGDPRIIQLSPPARL